MRTPLIAIGLYEAPATFRDTLTLQQSWLLTARSRFPELQVLGVIGPRHKKDASLGTLFESAVSTRGEYTLELGVVLSDLFPIFDDALDYEIAVKPRRHGSKSLCISNQMVRVNENATGERWFSLQPKSVLKRTFTEQSLPPFEALRTMATMRFTLKGPTAETAVEGALEECCEDLGMALNDFLAGYAMIEDHLHSTHSIYYDSRSFSVIYLAVAGDNGEPRAHRVTLNIGRGVLNPFTLSAPQQTQLNQYVSGAQPVDDVRLMLVSARTAFQSGSLHIALLQVVIAAEMATARFISFRYLAAGVSRTKWDDAKTELTYSQMLNLHLMVVTPTDRRPDVQIVALLNAARRARNELMHEGKFEISRERLEEFLGACGEYIAYLNSLALQPGPPANTPGDSQP